MTPVTIALGASGTLVLGVPSPVQLHHIELPANEFGLQQIMKILKARARGADDQKISRQSNPTQWQVEAWLKAERIEREEHKRQAELAAAEAALSAFKDVELGELDL